MNFAAILALALGLSMDAMAAAAAQGVSAKTLRIRDVLWVALLFGGFQALMPALGIVLGRSLGPVVGAWGHFIAFILLSAIGGKMLWEARHAFSSEPPKASALLAAEPFDLPSLVVLAIATSVDAFAAGVTLPMLNAPLFGSLAIIGATTALLSALGVVLGQRFGGLLGRYLDVVGGLVLIALGVKMLVEHITAA